jgi:hypothetical protein
MTNDDGLLNVVNLSERFRDEGLVEILDQLLADAKSGKLIGMAGMFLQRDPKSAEPSLLIAVSPAMVDHAIIATGAIERMKLDILSRQDW